MSTSTLDLPSTAAQWRTRATRNGLAASSIHTAKLTSASKVQENQYLLGQVLWKQVLPTDFHWARFELDEWQAPAKNLLSNYASWKMYCDSLAEASPVSPGRNPESTFALVREFQKQAASVADNNMTSNVTVTPRQLRSVRGSLSDRFRGIELGTPSRSTGIPSEESDSEEDEASPVEFETPGVVEFPTQIYQQTKDEQIVNTALINFLSALTLHSGIQNRWSIHRLPLKAQFTHATFEARTDGYLEDTPRGKVRALVEVKAAIRGHEVIIRMQEAAQMIAWLKSHPDRGGRLNRPGRRLHVCQDRHQIFIIFAKYDDEYLDFLEGTSRSTPSNAFLTMFECGPWNTQDHKQMKHLADILVAISLRAADDYEAEQQV